MKSNNIRRLALVFIIGGLLLTIPVLQAKALTVSPVRVELAGDPGKAVGGTFKVINEENEVKTLYTVFENFEAMGETGSPNFVQTKEGLATWISAPKQITVGPGETKEVDFAVNVPSSAEPGGYFSAIFLATTPPSENQSQLSIGARIGMLLLFRVNGNIQEGASLLEFKAKDGDRFFKALPIDFYYRFQNSGADRVMPKGNITIRNIFGRQVKVVNANSIQGNVLPRSIRRFDVWWQKAESDTPPTINNEKKSFFEEAKYQWNNFALGRYTAELGIAYGSQNQNVVAKYSIFVFPWQLILVELIILIVVIAILYFGIKGYNSWIIKKSRS